MERNFLDDDDEFESFLKEKADQYKLYPSDKVWNGIYNFFHTSRKWYTLTGTVLLFTTLFFIGLHITPEDNFLADYGSGDPLNNFNFLPAAGIAHSSEIANRAGEESFPFQTETAVSQAINNNTLISQVFTDRHLQTIAKPGAAVDFTTASSPTPRKQNTMEETLSEAPSLRTGTLRNIMPDEKKPLQNKVEKTTVDKAATVNWLHELAVNRLSLHPLKNHLNLQFYASPTASYRRLRHFKTDLSTKSNNISPLSGDPVNIDGIVDQHPAVGLELGSALLFNASNRIVFKAGLQFNYVRYAINAYQSYPEKTAITLSSVGHRSPVDTITAYSSIRNLGGRYPEALQNQYAEISLPIGAEFKLLGNKRFQVNFGGTIQPTYLLYNNTYLLTSDYGNYTKDPGLVRRWNVNTALEAYISYSMGGLRWQLGPQFRYQLLSTYNDLYPIREYLMEYGLKIGISKTLK